MDPIGEGINNGSPYSFTSKLPNPLVVTGEHENDYIQFTYGGLSWQSKTSNGGAYCNNGGWDPRDGPICGQRVGNQNAVNNMDCFFPCWKEMEGCRAGLYKEAGEAWGVEACTSVE